MRLIIDTLIAAMLVALIGVLVQQKQGLAQSQDDVESLRRAMQQIRDTSMVHAASDTKASPSGYAETLDQKWFVIPPRNPLVDHAKENWVDQAAADEADRLNPRVIVAGGTYAPFWYNGYQGIVRARVPMLFSQQDTVDLYNEINGTNLSVWDCTWEYLPPAPTVPAPQSKPEPSPQEAPTEESVESRLIQDFSARITAQAPKTR